MRQLCYISMMLAVLNLDLNQNNEADIGYHIAVFRPQYVDRITLIQDVGFICHKAIQPHNSRVDR